MPQIKAVFFDAAGTLFETREPVGETYARIARAYGVEASSVAVEAAFRRTFHEAGPLAFGPGQPAEELRRLERDWWCSLVGRTFAGLGEFADFASFFNSLFEFFAEPAHWLADPEALTTLNRLRDRGLKLGVISNFDHRLYRILDGLGLGRRFDSITISSEVGFAKPAPALFTAALEHHRLAAAEALHVGDSEQLDLAGAVAVGMKAVLIQRKQQGPVSIAHHVARVSSLGGTLQALDFFDRPSGDA